MKDVSYLKVFFKKTLLKNDKEFTGNMYVGV